MAPRHAIALKTKRLMNERVDAGTYDLLVVGGGINGAGIACDASGRGLKVLLCEQGDLGGATSSASSKLIHGGLRYLEKFEIGLVRESLAEREILLRKAPHIVTPLKFILPLGGSRRPAWMIRLGLYLYDHLDFRRTLPRSQVIRLEELDDGNLLKSEMAKGFSYYDCRVDDSRLVVFNAMQAATNGAVLLTRTRLSRACRRDGGWEATLTDLASGGSRQVRARGLVNACGPWAMDVLDRIEARARPENLPSRPYLHLIKGSHIVVPRLYRGDYAFLLQNQDRRVVFVIPYEGRFSLIGTTETALSGNPGKVAIDQAEIRYLCDAANAYFTRAVTPDDVVWSYSGVRALYDDNRDNASALSREFALTVEAPDRSAPLLNVFGGKITTYRLLAEKALSLLRPYFPNMGASWTLTAPLPGGEIGKDMDEFVTALAGRYGGFPRHFLETLARRHGSLCDAVLGDAQSLRDMGNNFEGGLSTREIDYFIEREWARTPDDILWRRTKCGLHLSSESRSAFNSYLANRI